MFTNVAQGTVETVDPLLGFASGDLICSTGQVSGTLVGLVDKWSICCTVLRLTGLVFGENAVSLWLINVL